MNPNDGTPTRVIPGGYHLPSNRAGGVDGLLGLAAIFGEEEVFAFLGMAHANDSPVGDVRAILAARQIARHMARNEHLTFSEGRRQAARDAGYTGTLVSNFRRLALRGRDLLRERGEWPFDPSRDE